MDFSLPGTESVSYPRVKQVVPGVEASGRVGDVNIMRQA